MQPSEIYDDIVLSFEEIDYNWLDELIKNREESERSVENLSPSMFLDNQPKPKSGVICYMAAFSDQ